MYMVEIRNRKTLKSKVNICKSDVKIGDYADSLRRFGETYRCLTGSLSVINQYSCSGC